MAREGWLGEGWVRDHKGTLLHRVPGELHRGPPGHGGWTDGNLAIMLRSHSQGNAAKMRGLRAARTRLELLVLAHSWDLPFITQEQWLHAEITDPAWFYVSRPEGEELEPMHRGLVCALALEKDMARPPESASPDWEWQETLPSYMNQWFTPRGHNRLRARSCPLCPGAHLWVGASVEDLLPRFRELLFAIANPQDGIVVVEALPESGLETGRMLAKAFEQAFEVRRHRLELSRWVETAGAWVFLGPDDRLDGSEDHSAPALEGASLVTVLVRESASDLLRDKDTTIRVMKEHFESSSQFEKEEVMQLLWSHPVEGASRHVVVAVETKFDYFCPGVPTHSGSKMVYALIDTASGRLLDSISEILPTANSAPQHEPNPTRTRTSTRAAGEEEEKTRKILSPQEVLAQFLG